MPAATAKPEFNSLKVAAVRPLTADSVAVSFAVPDGLQSNYSFVPGQYLTLRATLGDDEVRRSYSICSAVGEPLEVGIKHLPGGLFSTYAQSLQAGDVIDVMTPQGNFTALPGGQHHYLLIAAGSGVTPCLSIAKTVLAQEPDSRITFLYGNRNTASIMFRQDLSDLKDLHTERLMLINFLSQEQQESEWLNGRIDEEKIAYLIASRLIDVARYDTAYVCGPLDMVQSVQRALGDDLPVKTELFTTGSHQPARAALPDAAHGDDSVTVRVTIEGTVHRVAVNAKQETVLSAAQRAGLDLPFSCAGGMCCTCRCKVLSGKTSMDMNFSLADWEVAAGFTLACQTRPLDGDVTLDFDEI
jgi:ring-1,2-phenylacetyl-CoA epoxidase subunit PaaE